MRSLWVSVAIGAILTATAWAGPEARGRAAIEAGSARRSVAVLSDDSLQGRRGGTEGHREAARWLGSVFQGLGLAPGGDAGSYQQHFGNGQNVVGVLPGRGRGYVVVGAHLDHVGVHHAHGYAKGLGDDTIHNGADDNASGIAGVIEVARAFKAAGVQPERSVVFVGFDYEESGMGGSRHLVEQLDEDVSLMINLDMVGRLERDLFVYGANAGEHNAAWLAAANRVVGLPLVKMPIFNLRSDSTSFLENGIPALYLTTGVHPEYHMPTDEIETINAQGIAKVAQLVFGVAARAAMAESNAFSEPRSRSGLFPLNTPPERSLTLDGVLAKDYLPTFRLGLLTFDLEIPKSLLSALEDVAGPSGELRVTGKARLESTPSGFYRVLTPTKIESPEGPVFVPVDLRGVLEGPVLTTDSGDTVRVDRGRAPILQGADGRRVRVRGWTDGQALVSVAEVAGRKSDGAPVWVKPIEGRGDFVRVREPGGRWEKALLDSLTLGQARTQGSADGALGALQGTARN